MNWIKIDDITYRYDDGGVYFFLLLGTEYALLIDSGMNTHNAKELAEEITSLPVKLFNTHADRDHIGSNAEFSEIMMNPAELVNYSGFPSQMIVPVYDGDIIDPGSRPLKAIYLPGHTPGSTALLDINSGMLFSGDPVQNGRIFMFGPMRNMDAYILSLERLLGYEEQIKDIYPCHGTCPVEPSIISKLIEAAKRVVNGEIEPKDAELFGNTISVYNAGVATFLCEKSDVTIA